MNIHDFILFISFVKLIVRDMNGDSSMVVMEYSIHWIIQCILGIPYTEFHIYMIFGREI